MKIMISAQLCFYIGYIMGFCLLHNIEVQIEIDEQNSDAKKNRREEKKLLIILWIFFLQ